MSSTGASNSTTRPLPAPGAPADYFATTRWTLVVNAGKSRTPQSARALEELCEIYWYPLYAYARHNAQSREDAEDLTQGFFASFLQHNYLKGLDPSHGRFRAFLLASFKHYVINEHHRAHRQKRGGNVAPLSLDWQDADERYGLEPADNLSPDKLFDRAWAILLLDRVIGRLREECAAQDKANLFERLKLGLTAGKGAIDYPQTAADLKVSEAALRVAVHRLRRRYRELLREEIGQTLSDPAHADEELSALFGAFSG